MKTESERIYEEYLGILNEALDLFNKRKFKEARAAFSKLKNGDVPEFKEKAEIYLEIIEKLTSRKRVKVEEDPVSAATRLINEKDPEGALEILQDADEKNPKVWYLRALAFTLSGNTSEAAQALKKAVSLNRRFYFLSKKEPDLFPLWDTGLLEDL